MAAIKLLSAFSVLACIFAVSQAGFHKVCKDQPADIAIIIDESTSIWPVHFVKLRDFIANLTQRFTIGPNVTRFAALTFANKVTPRFTFSDYKASEDVKKAILSIDQKHGGTQTHSALRYVRHKVIPRMREDVSRIAILITDGASWYPEKTEKEALLLHRRNVTVFVVAVSSQIRYSEIKSIASDPDDRHVFSVNSYADLSETLVKELVSSACSIKDTPGVCHLKLKTDVMFVTASISQNPAGAVSALGLAESVITDDNTYIGSESLQFGVVPSSCQLDIGFKLDSYHNKLAMIGHIKRMQKTMIKSPSDHINYMTDYSFAPRNGGRNEIRKVAVVIMDRSSPVLEETILAAQRAKDAGIEIIAVAVGKSVSDSEISQIASEPLSTHKITLSDYSELDEFKQKFYAVVCP